MFFTATEYRLEYFFDEEEDIYDLIRVGPLITYDGGEIFLQMKSIRLSYQGSQVGGGMFRILAVNFL